VVGELHGGDAACSNDRPDWYGRLSYAWDEGVTDSTRLSTWLDPLGTGAVTLDLFDPKDVSSTPVVATLSAANHPNPFNPVTRIVYTVPKAGHLSLKVFDIRGRLVRTLVDDRVEAGADQIATWDGRNDAGAAVSSGVYFYEARTGGEVKVGKMALVK
jgi:hypothetical protein